MTEAYGYTCPKCREIVFGITWLNGELTLFSTCTCGGEKHYRAIPLDRAVCKLGPEQDSNNFVTKGRTLMH